MLKGLAEMQVLFYLRRTILGQNPWGKTRVAKFAPRGLCKTRRGRGPKVADLNGAAGLDVYRQPSGLGHFNRRSSR